MKVILETNQESVVKDLAWLKSKWWFRLFNATLWVASILLAIFVVITAFVYTSEGCHAATLDTLDTYTWGKAHPADSAKTEEVPKAFSVGSDGRILEHETDNSDDPLGLFENKSVAVTEEEMMRDLGIKEKGKDYWCVVKALLMCAVGISVIFILRKTLELLFVYIAIGSDQD